MTRSIATMVCSTLERTKLPRAYVEQRARAVQNAGLIQLGRGAVTKPRDLAHLLIALAADTVRHAPAMVNRYCALERLVEADHTRAGDALEALVTRIWSGDRDAADKTVRIVQTWPEVIITERDDEQHRGSHYYEDGQIMECHALTDVRRSIEIPGSIIAQIGADLGLRGCNYAI